MEGGLLFQTELECSLGRPRRGCQARTYWG